MDLTGQTFSSLTVVSRAPNAWRKNGKQMATMWNCRCECGKESIVSTGNLRSGGTRSCGCLLLKIMGSQFKTHGKSETAAYRAWGRIKNRCSNPLRSNYYYYGAKGVTVCDRWLNSFENFYADMGDPPSPSHSIDRKDNSLGYSPDNCKWSTRIEQANNKSNNVFFAFNGQNKTIPEWSRESGVSRAVLYYRIQIKRWPIDKALSTPVRRSSR